MSDELSPERALLGMALTSEKAYQDAEQVVDPADFSDPRYGALWGLIGRMSADGRPHGPVAVAGALKSIPEEMRRGIDAIHLSDLYGSAPVGSAAFYARQVAGEATRRRGIAAGTRIVQLFRDSDLDELPGVVEASRAEVDNAGKVVSDVKDFGDVLTRFLDSLEQPVTYVPTPWPDLNHLIGGWRPGALYVIGARPGVGKSVLGIQAAVGLAEHGPVALSSLEMTEDEVASRIVAQRANVPLGHLIDHEMTETDWRRIADAHGQMHALPVIVDDKSDVTPLNIRAHARTVKRRRGALSGIVVDYLQLMSSPRGEKRPRHEVVADFSRQLKLMAKELHVPVIALSQLNRKSAERHDARPSISDLRESGAVEQDADVVMLLHSTEDRPDVLEVGVAKNRHGVRGALSLTFEGAYQRATPLKWSPTDRIGA